MRVILLLERRRILRPLPWLNYCRAADNENRAKVWEIQNRFLRIGSQNIVEPARRFLREGILFKLSLTDNSLQKRIAYLFSDLFLTAMPLGGLQKQDKLMGLLSAAVLDRDTQGPYPYMFWFVSPVKTIIFVTNTKEDKITWLDDINNAITQLIAANPHLAEERSKYEILTDDDGTPFMIPIGGNIDVENSPSQAAPKSKSKPFVKFKNLVANTVEGFLDLVSRQSKPQSSTQLPQPTGTSVQASPEIASETSVSREKNIADDDGFVELNEPSSSSLSEVEQTSLLLNKGMVQLHHENVCECSGHIMWTGLLDIPLTVFLQSRINILSFTEDKRHERTFPITSTYIVFPESYFNVFYRDIGSITLENQGSDPILLVSHQRKSDGDRMTYYKLPANKREIFEYRGCWCIEVRQGNCADLFVLDTKPSGGSGHCNNLNML